MVNEHRSPGRPEDPDLRARREGEILSTAARLFAERGYAETQVQTIADALAVGNGTIYRYFPTKEKLFLSAVERGLDELTEQMRAVMEAECEPLETMRQAFLAYFRFFHMRPHMAELFIQERAAFREHHRPLYFSAKCKSEEESHDAFFAKLVAEGLLRDMPQARFYDFIGDLLYGAIITNLLTGRRVPPEVQASEMLDVIFHGVLSGKARRRLANSSRKRAVS
jgi:AcrR family transcriptional regulator